MIEKTGNTETGITMYNSVNVIKDLITKPGELFIMKDEGEFSGFNKGVIFVGVLGVVLALAFIALGVPATHAQAPPSMIFGFAPY